MPRITDEELDEIVRRETRHTGSLANGRPVMLWDLDSTVCRTVHRRHLVPLIREGKATWDQYAMMCADDEPIEGSVALMRLLATGPGAYRHIAVSGRGSSAAELTWGWTARHGVPLAAIILRPSGDHTPNGTWKVGVIRALQRAGADIRLCFEDWAAAAAVIRAETGIPVVGINPFDPEPEEDLWDKSL
jgi:hypothetical protein